MYILHVCAELFPLLKTGGLADVVAALPLAQSEQGAQVRILLPAFPAIKAGIHNPQKVTSLNTFAGTVDLQFGIYKGIGIYLIDAPHLYERPGSPYHNADLHAYPDNYRRFALLGWVAAELASGCDYYWRPQVVHAHDWHAGLACAYLAARGRPSRSIFTIHNLAYQGLFAAHHLSELSLPENFFHFYGLEFHGQISFLKAGIYYADHVTTVSPTYAQEITHPEFAHGMEGLLSQLAREGRLTGILNGVDDSIWDPAHDNLIPHCYQSSTLKTKAINKQHLQTTMGLQVDAEKTIFAVVSRLSQQKGLDLVLDTLPEILNGGGQLALLGTGDVILQEAFLAAAAEHPGQVSVQIGYHEAFSHRIIAGADVILVPSRFEPCGLTQLYGLKYGTLPLVRYTGGLADTVNDCSLENLSDGSANGFVFFDCSAKALSSAVRRALVLRKRPTLWRYVQRQAMTQDFSWHQAASHYMTLYQTSSC